MIAVTSRPIPKRIINECVASKLIAGNTEPCEPCLQQPRGWVSRAGGAQSLSHVQLFVTPWTIACQAPLSMGFSRQGYWSGLPCPSPGDFSNPGIEPTSLKSLALAGGFFTTRATWEARSIWHGLIIPQSYSHTAWLLLNYYYMNVQKWSDF